jgi:predicted esterase
MLRAICAEMNPVPQFGPVDPHKGQQILRGGAPLAKARTALVLIHGRGAAAEDIYGLGEEVSEGISGVALFAPQAAGNAWYPQRFFAPLAQNEPYLSSALGVVGDLVGEIARGGVGFEKIVLIGFSQGACLSLEFAARNPRRYGGVVGLSGAVIGPPGTPRAAKGNLEGTPVYLGCSDNDAHIPLSSVEESAVVFSGLGARVTKSIFAGMGHTVNAEELAVVQGVIRGLAGGV